MWDLYFEKAALNESSFVIGTLIPVGQSHFGSKAVSTPSLSTLSRLGTWWHFSWKILNYIKKNFAIIFNCMLVLNIHFIFDNICNNIFNIILIFYYSFLMLLLNFENRSQDEVAHSGSSRPPQLLARCLHCRHLGDGARREMVIMARYWTCFV